MYTAMFALKSNGYYEKQTEREWCQYKKKYQMDGHVIVKDKWQQWKTKNELVYETMKERNIPNRLAVIDNCRGTKTL